MFFATYPKTKNVAFTLFSNNTLLSYLFLYELYPHIFHFSRISEDIYEVYDTSPLCQKLEYSFKDFRIFTKIQKFIKINSVKKW